MNTDDFAAECLDERFVLVLGVDHDYVIVWAAQEHVRNLHLAALRLTRATGAENEAVAVGGTGAISHERVAALCVHAVPVATGNEQLLRGEGHNDCGSGRGQGAPHGDTAAADR